MHIWDLPMDKRVGCPLYYMCHGNSVKKDTTKTREWWTKAAAQGNEDAIKFLKTLDKEEG